ncbi:MAG TPA: sigma-70 family RNA polymerase sigma factor [Kofleriaceae bacterium]
MTESVTHAAIAAIWKQESPRVIAVLTRIVRDVGLAEELVHDALVVALEQWPRTGMPDSPVGWLVTTARNRAIDAVRRRRMIHEKHEALGHELATHVRFDDIEAELQHAFDDVRDDVLRLIFIACHPVLARDARVALTLRLLGGLTTAEIARAFLVPEPTISQRIVRAKRTLADANVPFELPSGDALGERLASVLEVVYLIFNEGYSATAGEDVIRPALVEEALRLARLLADLAPNESEVLGLLALLELQASRSNARVDAAGEPVLLLDQDRARWDRALIASGLAHLAQADQLATTRGPYHLQAAIAACHARAAAAADTDWTAIAMLYAELGERTPSPVIALNHAVAVSRAEGPAAGLALLDALAGEPALARYHLFASARADLLEQLGRFAAARAEFERAAALTDNVRSRQRLLRRAAACAAR